MPVTRPTLPFALLVAALWLATRPLPALAECPYFPIPPASAAIPSAREVIVGSVLRNVGGQAYTFDLRVDVVLRGSAVVGEIRTIDNLFPGWPLATTEEGPLAPCEPIPGSPGNVMVLAYGALGSDGATRYTAASWIRGLPEFRQESDVERLSLEEIRALASLPTTDAGGGVAASGNEGESDGGSMWPLVAAGVLGLFLSIARLRRVSS
jgi:hypothetical protein